jgi:predicted amidohydrolase
MKIAALQHDIVFEDAVATRAHVAPMIAQAGAAHARIIVLTEMFATGFSMCPERFAEDEGGPSEQFLIDQAHEHEAWLIASIAQRGADGRYRNNAVVAGPDGSVSRYSKIHPFSYAHEHEHYAAGAKYLTVDIDGLRTTVFICYDIRFSDEFWERASSTDLYVVPANWPEPRRDHWRTLLRARAIENQAYMVGVNRVGAAKGLVHLGDSAIIDPLGRTLAEASVGEAVLVAEVRAETVADVRTDFPFLADRRRT